LTGAWPEYRPPRRQNQARDDLSREVATVERGWGDQVPATATTATTSAWLVAHGLGPGVRSLPNRDLVRALGAAPAFLGGEVMRGGAAFEPPSFDAASRGERTSSFSTGF
jgi:hypothetical protein